MEEAPPKFGFVNIKGQQMPVFNILEELNKGKQVTVGVVELDPGTPDSDWQPKEELSSTDDMSSDEDEPFMEKMTRDLKDIFCNFPLFHGIPKVMQDHLTESVIAGLQQVGKSWMEKYIDLCEQVVTLQNQNIELESKLAARLAPCTCCQNKPVLIGESAL